MGTPATPHRWWHCAAVAALAAAGVCGCQEAAKAPAGVRPAVGGAVELGVGAGSVRFAPCIARQGPDGGTLQIVGDDTGDRLLYVEITDPPADLPPDDPLDPSRVVLRLDGPLAADEPAVYQDHDVRLHLEGWASGVASGRVSGRVEDLLRGRTYEVRGRFDCPIEAPRAGDMARR